MISLLDLLFPKFCTSCGILGSYLCNKCTKTIKPVLFSEAICPVCERISFNGKTHPYCRTNYSLDGIISFFHYTGGIKTAVKKMKYQFISDIGIFLANLSMRSQNILENYPQIQEGTIVPVPLHRLRYRYRGFNQAELFGKTIAEIYKLPFRRDILQRIKISVPQVEMRTREGRMKNMNHVFVVKTTTVPRVVILVDDVFTTGATMREAGKVLKQHGAKSVWGMTIAR